MTSQEQLLQSIFGKSNQPHFVKPEPNPHDDLRAEIDKMYKKVELDTLFKEYLAPLIRKKSNQHKGFEQFLPMLQPGPKPMKPELVHLWATIVESAELFGVLLSQLSEPVREVLNLLLYEYNAGKFHVLEEAVPKAKIDSRITFLRYHRGEKPVEPEFSLFACTNGDEESVEGKYYTVFALFLPPLVRQKLRQYLPVPANFTIQPLDESPKAEFHYNAEASAVQVAELVSRFILGHRLEYDAAGKKPLKASLKKLQAYSGLQEFYPRVNKDLEFLATELLVNIAQAELNVINSSSDSANGLGVLRAWLRNYADGSLRGFFALESILFHIKVSSSYYGDTIAEINRGQPLLDVLVGIPLGKWVKVRNLLRVLKLNEESFYPISTLDAKKKLYIPVTKEYGAEKDFIHTPDLYDEAITMPFLKGSLALLAAMGIVEMVFSNPANNYQRREKSYLSVFDGIKGVRLTALGEYLLGKSSEYNVAQTRQDAEGVLTLDEHRLLAKLSAKNSLLELQLQDFMRPIASVEQSSGAILYKMDYASFLKECRDRDDVSVKIAQFKSEISAKLPPVWERFFAEVLHRIEPFTEELQYRVFTLPPSQDLMKLLTQDEVLKKIIIKAEGYKILVPKREIATLRKRLEKHGYLFSGK